MGPTASGKTELAVELIQQLPCEIISVDSAMVYRGMNIGTAKPNAEILKIAPHHLLDIRDPAETYSAGDFRRDVLTLIGTIFQKNRIPLLVGGTMLYFHVLQNGLAELPAANPEIRANLSKEAEIQGWPFLHEKLQKIDPLSAQKIKPNDSQRIQRALEVYELSQQPLSSWFTEKQPDLPFSIINLALVPQNRERLHQKIAERFQKMLQQGFVEEVQQLYQRGDLHADLPSIRAVGYRQIWDYLRDQLSYKDMQERGIIATRQLAKRQLTWLKSWKNLQYFTSEDPQLSKIIETLKPQMRS